MCEWRDSFVKHWDAAVAGSSALRAAILRNLRSEIGAWDRQIEITTLYDADKNYDSISLVKLICESLRRITRPDSLPCPSRLPLLCAFLR